MAARLLLVLVFALWAGETLGQLFLGPCPEPPNYLPDVDLEKYSGRWHLVNTTLFDADRLNCTTVDYRHNVEKNELKVDYSKPLQFMSTKGRLVPDKSGGFSLYFDDGVRKRNQYVLYTDYDNVTVEYRCLSGVLSATEDVLVFVRDPHVHGDIDDLHRSFRLAEVIPEKYHEKLRSVQQSNC